MQLYRSSRRSFLAFAYLRQQVHNLLLRSSITRIHCLRIEPPDASIKSEISVVAHNDRSIACCGRCTVSEPSIGMSRPYKAEGCGATR